MPTVVDIVLQDMFQLSKSFSISPRTQRTGLSLEVRLSLLEIAPSATILGCQKRLVGWFTVLPSQVNIIRGRYKHGVHRAI